MTTDDQVDALRRGLRTTREGDDVVSVQTIERTYPTTPEDLWEACTTAERLERWFAKVDGRLELGGEYAVQGNASGVVEACDPPRSFRLTWVFGGATTWVTVEVAPDGDGARLRLTHEGAVPGDVWRQFGPGATGIGWDGSLMTLARYLETGEPAPHPELTDEARAFIRASGERWAQAAVDAGDEPEDAHAAAERTIAFFCGEGPGVAG